MKNEKDIKLTERDFEFVQLEEDIKDQKFEGEAIGFFKDAFMRFRKNKGSLVAFIFIAIIAFFSIFGPAMNEYSFREQNPKLTFMPPRIPGIEKLGIFDGSIERNLRKTSLETKYKDSIVKVVREYEERGTEMVVARVNMYKYKGVEDKYFWFGTDYLGRDQWTRLWRGTRISFAIALLAVTVNLVIGVVYGSISGYYGGMIDVVMQRIVEILISIPRFVIIILFLLYMGAGIVPIALSLVLTGWVGMNYLIRAQFYKYKGQEYVLASRTLGATDSRLIFRHILPNAIGPIITSVTFAVPVAIFSESFLAYLGLGIQAPEPSIGVLLAEGQKELLNYPHLILFPAIVISILMISFNLFGNGLRDAFDPTLRGQE
ncbi:ABC transporter permease [Paramaledivibacter caminithermalis]|jgi:oligopeptide transport system permease protein|uniref:Oligopeptide transport system permease protein n=1 Tax=Paramaledivibacter caminithermalis (strain DSM 15212 / CIP 107654 / DViRD3) TaxID=1121301 RepID=A0A1M6KRI7_PARC5|nr:ABC transporter permease [Paramaledivibacter caminithermalis]SHJ61545.1 oligopeptide transport system permease protein [Paramaledivibacter caminithermalis DSM 15212]